MNPLGNSRGTGFFSAVLFALMGVALVFFYWHKQSQAADLLKNGRQVQGKILDASGGKTKGDPVVIVYAFEAAGETHQIRRISNLVRPPEVGTFLRVTHDRENPRRCLSEYENATHEFAVLFPVTGALCIVFAALRIFLLLRTGKKA